MKKEFHELIVTLLILLLFGCKPAPEVRFMEAQPTHARDLNSFPGKYQGKYRSKSDSSVLTIDANMITTELLSVVKISKHDMQEELDTVFHYDTEVPMGDKLIMTVKIDGDSAILRTYGGIDTLFLISEESKLRSFKGYLFLNHRQSDLTWRVSTLQLINDELDFNVLVSHHQIDTLKDITLIVAEIDSSANRIIHYDLDPKRKELKKILKIRQTETGYKKIR